MAYMTVIMRMVMLLVLAFVVPTMASAQALRIGYVDMKEVLDNAPQVVAGRDQIDLEFRPRNEAIVSEEQRADQIELRLGQGDIDDTARGRLERELRELRRSINRQREDLRDELSFRRTEEVQRLEDQINVAVQSVAELHGFDLILSSPVVYASDALDITDLILQQLQVEFDADQRERLNR